MDFTRDTLASSRVFRTLNIIDEFNREVLAIEVDTSLPAERVIRVLDQIKAWRPLPQSIRVDNGPEFIAEALGQLE
jgi:putative transposase